MQRLRISWALRGRKSAVSFENSWPSWFRTTALIICILSCNWYECLGFSSTATSVVDLKMTDFTTGTKTNHEPVIFLHGLLGSKRNFASLATSLAAQLKKKRPIIAVDLRNHGENSHDWRPDMSYTEMARDVLALIDKCGYDNAILVGHSMGGKVAKACALLEPEKIGGLVVLDIAPVEYSVESDPTWKAVSDIVHNIASIEFCEGQTKRDVDVLLRPLVQDPALRAFVLTNIDAPKTAKDASINKPSWKINMDAIVHQMDTLAGFDLPAQSLEYPGDVFFIHGGQSRFVRHSHIETIQGYFPNHMLTTIRGAGHWVHAEAPDDTLALLKRYLDR